jgi:hypothetical protein
MISGATILRQRARANSECYDLCEGGWVLLRYSFDFAPEPAGEPFRSNFV